MSGGTGFHTSALGTDCFLLGSCKSPSIKAIDIFLGLIDEMDHVASRFRSDSELSQIFNGAAQKEVVVSELLFAALEAALYGARITNGYLDPTVGGSLAGLGYKTDFRSSLASGSAAPGKIQVVLPRGYKSLRLNKANRSVSVLQGVKLDLGATGKAFLADRIKYQIEIELSEKVLVNLGGDISASLVDRESYWPINVTEDLSLDSQSDGQIIAIAGGGVATSSTLRRSWNSGPQQLHHIIDPFSGISSESVYHSVTVLAGSALDANIASSGTIAMGPDGPKWLASLRLPALARSKEYGENYFGGWQRAGAVGSHA